MPAIIDKGRAHDLIVGNFDAPDEARGAGFTMLLDLGNGVALFKREDR